MKKLFKIKTILFVLITTIVVSQLFFGVLKNVSYADEKNNIIYVNDPAGDIQNKYDKDNPFILPVGQEISLYAQFTNEEYSNAKANIRSTVYDNDGFLERANNGWDYLDDNQKRLCFRFKALKEGLCRIIVRDTNTQWGQDYIEELYVKVVKANTIYIMDPVKGDFIENPGNAHMYKDEEREFFIVFNNVATPDDTKYGPWSYDVDLQIDNKEWVKLENNRYMLKFTCKLERGGTVGFAMKINGNSFAGGGINLIVNQNVIAVNNISIRNQNYTNINKNIATGMFNGRHLGDNNWNNRYVVYVGENIDVSADGVPGQVFSTTNSDVLKTIKDSSEEDGVVKAIFKGVTPGNSEIVLKNGDETVETFNIEVKYPIFVNTSIGDFSKDLVHEYVATALEYDYIAHPENYITDPDGNVLYAKNTNTMNGKYYMNPNDTVILSIYAPKDDHTNFELSENLEIVPLTDHTYSEGTDNYVVEEVLTGDMADYKKITVEIKNKSNSGVESVKFGNSAFYMEAKNTEDKVNHFDFEIADGGSYTLIETTKLADGSKEIVKTTYKAYIRRVHGSEVLGKDGEVLTKLEEWEYWQHNTENESQYEATSAYITNEDGHLIDERGNDIDDLVKSGVRGPVVKSRDVNFSDVENVNFFADLHLVPIERKTTTIPADGSNDLAVQTMAKSDDLEEVDLDDITISMGKRDIIDALNKCPNHSGLDFTVRILLNVEHKVGNLQVSKTVENKKGDEEFSFKITIYDEEGNINTDVNGEYGDLEFVDGVATFKLKDDESVLILNLPAEMNYVVEETDSKGYTIKAEGNTGTIEAEKTLEVKYTNIGVDETKEPEKPEKTEEKPKDEPKKENQNEPKKEEPKEEIKEEIKEAGGVVTEESSIIEEIKNTIVPKTSDDVIRYFVLFGISFMVYVKVKKNKRKNLRK